MKLTKTPYRHESDPECQDQYVSSGINYDFEVGPMVGYAHLDDEKPGKVHIVYFETPEFKIKREADRKSWKAEDVIDDILLLRDRQLTQFPKVPYSNRHFRELCLHFYEVEEKETLYYRGRGASYFVDPRFIYHPPKAWKRLLLVFMFWIAVLAYVLFIRR